MPETRARREARRGASRSPRGGRRSATPGARAPSSTASARRSRTRGSSSLVHVGRVRTRGQVSPSPSPPPRSLTRPRAQVREGRRSRSRSRRGSTSSRHRGRGSPSRRGTRSRSPTLYRLPSQRPLRQRPQQGGAGQEGPPAWCTWGEGEQGVRSRNRHPRHPGHSPGLELKSEGAGGQGLGAGEAVHHPGTGVGGRHQEGGRGQDRPPYTGCPARGSQVQTLAGPGQGGGQGLHLSGP